MEETSKTVDDLAPDILAKHKAFIERMHPKPKQEHDGLELSDTVHITDPCYSRGTWCAVWNVKIKPGKYTYRIGLSDEEEWGMRVNYLAIYHESLFHMDRYKFKWEAQAGEIGVDSGQAGIFDDTLYPHGEETGECGDEDTFYGKACTATLGDKSRESGEVHGGLVDGKGVASRSGYGDGGYSWFAKKNAEGEIIAIKIVFIGD